MKPNRTGDGDWKLRRQLLFKRDKGVCAACRADTLKIRRVLSVLFKTDPDAWHFYTKYVGVSGSRAVSGALWDADHILEVIRGGQDTLANLQTLCVGCHREKTQRLIRERARVRRQVGLVA